MKTTKTLYAMLFGVLLFSNVHAQMAWLKVADYPGIGKLGVTSFSIGNKGYLGFGYDGVSGNGNTDWYEYDVSSNAWTQKASLPSTGLWSPVSFVIGSKGYVITGAINGGASNESWEYDPSVNTWTAKASFPGIVRANASGFSIGNKGYVGTGYSSGTTLDDFYEFDPVANTWTTKASFPGATRSGAIGFSINGMGYMGMGSNTNSTVNYQDFYQYNPVNDVWVQKADFPLPSIVAPCGYSSASMAYVLCGFYYQYSSITYNPLNMLYRYDPTSDAWDLKGTFCGLPRGYAGGFAISNDLYIGCGGQRNDGNPLWLLNDVWKLANGLTLMPTPGPGESNTDFSVFPIPSRNTISFKGLPKNATTEKVRIYNEGGQLISELGHLEGRETMDISKMANGLYYMELILKDGRVLDSSFLKE